MTAPAPDDAVAVRLRGVLRAMPGPVSLVTSCDPDDGAPVGLAASAVIPVTLDPPSMLVALHQQSRACAAIDAAERFCINLVGTAHAPLVALFGDGALRQHRFAGDAAWATLDAIPYLADACANIFCRTASVQRVGTHALFVGEVYEVRAHPGTGGAPLGWIEGGLATLHQI